ncbi:MULTISPECIES: nucleotidyltransferase family protein [Paraburkholderia]|uniref:nucleotidyltransferase family protein n=1 Tax=Paraburkholderia TaxID=1822464 RepID=UPI000484AB70|nr:MULTISPECIES: nucleotidyltransferase domain-containing protein [Paraburkholderia]MCP3718011.1 nucleotidyltransferase domain-containing protein [Paraburkholderia sp. CNPSo 3281]
MRPSEALRAHRAEIRAIVASHHATNARVFGSSAREEDDEDSDLDLLVDPTPQTSLFDLARIQSQLEALLGVPVDVRTPKDLPERIRLLAMAEAVPV